MQLSIAQGFVFPEFGEVEEVQLLAGILKEIGTLEKGFKAVIQFASRDFPRVVPLVLRPWGTVRFWFAPPIMQIWQGFRPGHFSRIVKSLHWASGTGKITPGLNSGTSLQGDRPCLVSWTLVKDTPSRLPTLF